MFSDSKCTFYAVHGRHVEVCENDLVWHAISICLNQLVKGLFPMNIELNLVLSVDAHGFENSPYCGDTEYLIVYHHYSVVFKSQKVFENCRTCCLLNHYFLEVCVTSLHQWTFLLTIYHLHLLIRVFAVMLKGKEKYWAFFKFWDKVNDSLKLVQYQLTNG